MSSEWSCKSVFPYRLKLQRLTTFTSKPLPHADRRTFYTRHSLPVPTSQKCATLIVGDGRCLTFCFRKKPNFSECQAALTQLYQSARYGKLKPPIVVVFGDDEFLVHRVIQRLTDLLLPSEERQTSLTILEGKEATEAELAQPLLNPLSVSS